MRTELELRQLRIFVTVVDVGTHTRAARSLGVSQSTVSETLHALERTLGVALFRKATRGLKLTPAGEVLLPYARRMLALSSELVAGVAGVSTDVSATLVISTVESLSAYVLPSRLASLRERWPKARLEVITAVCSDIRESVAAGKSDLGLVLEPDTGVADVSRLAAVRLVLFGSPQHPLARQKASPDQLRRCDFCMSDAAGSYHQVLRRYFEAAEVPLPRTQTLGTVEGVKRGVAAGGTALGLLPTHAVEQELGAGTLVEVTAHPRLPALALRAVVAEAEPRSPMVDDLMESLRSWRPEMPDSA